MLLFALLLLPLGEEAAQHLLPTPRRYEAQEGHLTLTQTCRLVATEESLQPIADYLDDYLPLRQGIPNALDSNLWLEIDPTLPREGYRLHITPLFIRIEGGDYRGVFYGVQTLLQLLPARVYSGSLELPCEVACCRVEDQPDYPYRGFHLDVARTWLPKERVMREIDHAAHHKLNVLHWHLTDDEGWRLEIRSHPELAEVGGFRGGYSPIEPVYGRWEERYGGYYTQEEIREVVEYARVRGVEIIPEIDLPGHSRAIARVHPEILCDSTPNLQRSAGYDLRNVWCVGREENYALLEDILGEVCDLFPSPYIHIGGDEVDWDQWKACPRCRALIERLDLPGVFDLHQYFALRLISILKSHGKKPVVWHEATYGGGLGQGTLVQAWERLREAEKSLESGYPTVVMPAMFFYFDMRQSEHEEGHSWADIFDVQQTYEFSTEFLQVSPEDRKRIVGFEGTFFSEIHLKNNPEQPDYLDYMLYPRLLAVAENSWRDQPRDWPAFRERMVEGHYARMEAMGIRFRLFPPEVAYREGLLSARVEDGSRLYYKEVSSPEERPYVGPISTDHPERYQFQSRLQAGRSPWVAHPSFYRTLEPEVRVTTSMPISPKTPTERVEKYQTFIRLTRTHHTGDWVEFTFQQPLLCREIFIQTGYFHLPRLTIRRGEVEVCYADLYLNEAGKTSYRPIDEPEQEPLWERVGALEGGCFTLHPERPLRAIRLRATETGNGEEYVLIQPLEIKP